MAKEWCPCDDGSPGCVDHPENTEYYTEYTITCGLCSYVCVASSEGERDSLIKAHTMVHNILGGTELEPEIDPV